MNRYQVDCRLNQQIIRIILQTISELEKPVEELLEVFEMILGRTITCRLEKLTTAELSNTEIDSIGLLMEGQGNVMLAETPTKAQENFVRSLTKVVLHDFSKNSKQQVVNYQSNLLVSLCVEKIYIERTSSTQPAVIDSSQLVHEVSFALQNRVKGSTARNAFSKGNEYSINFYQIPGEVDLIANTQISVEFDKIDIRDSEDGTEKTIVSMDPTLAWIPFSDDTMRQTRVHIMPSMEYENVWESLYFDENVKDLLYRYATIALKLSEYTACNEISFTNDSNRLILVHGPPGTGKTTVCKALCHKLAIRKHCTASFNEENIPRAILVELSCSKIFSRWFGESCKNIDNIFKDLEKLLRETASSKQFVCLLIDEVETIAFSRSSLINKNETTDAIRVVNTLLTQLDNLKKYTNFITLATSNLIDSMDAAFIDRADGIFSIPNPSVEGCKSILLSSIKKLWDAGVIKGGTDTCFKDPILNDVLMEIADSCFKSQLSGRTLRKLPVKALSERFTSLPVDISSFLVALASTVPLKHT